MTETEVYYSAWDGYLRCLNRGNGDLVWKWKSDKENFLFSPAACEPFITDKCIYVVTPERAVYGIHRITGKTVWKTQAHKVRESIGGRIGDSVFYVRCMEDTLCAYEAEQESGTGKLLWASKIGFGYDINPASSVVYQDKVIFTTHDGSVYFVSRNDGQLIKEIKLSENQLHKPIITDDGKYLCVSCMDGFVFLVRI